MQHVQITPDLLPENTDDLPRYDGAVDDLLPMAFEDQSFSALVVQSLRLLAAADFERSFPILATHWGIEQ